MTNIYSEFDHDWARSLMMRNTAGGNTLIQDQYNHECTKEYPSITGEDDNAGYATSYYELPKGAMEIGDLIEYRQMNFNVGNIFKACYRMGHKTGTTPTYDLNKIIYFAQRELRRRAKYE